MNRIVTVVFDHALEEQELLGGLPVHHDLAEGRGRLRHGRGPAAHPATSNPKDVRAQEWPDWILKAVAVGFGYLG